VILTIGATAFADVVTDWNNAALDTIRAQSTAPPVASRALAILHVSLYDAVNGIDRRHESYYVPSNVPASASEIAAASAAAHRVLITLFPGNAGSFDALHETTLALIPDRPQKKQGIAWGHFVADEILALRANDGADALVDPPDTTGPGAWEPTPPAYAAYLLPQWAFLTPFAMVSPAQFSSPGFPALDSAEYAAEYNEVREYGAAVGSLRTADQDQIAHFWADGAGTETPPGHWNSIAQDVGGQLGNSLQENARLFALLNIAMADAAICAWNAKYAYNFWRPVTAIREGDTDGNDATEADPSWSSFIVTPPFPEYVSGHSTFSGAAATVLAMFFGTDDIAFETGSDFLPGVTRTYTSFSAAAAEAAISRLYGGIHYPSGINHGVTAGVDLGEYTFMNYLRPEGNRSRK
jgi:membrane-associated phospholipid phosphatase